MTVDGSGNNLYSRTFWVINTMVRAVTEAMNAPQNPVFRATICRLYYWYTDWCCLTVTVDEEGLGYTYANNYLVVAVVLVLLQLQSCRCWMVMCLV